MTDYAVTLLSHMALGEKDFLWTAPALANQAGLPVPTVAKILKALGRSEILVAHRGATGGYKLAREASAIAIADIIETMDGPIAITDCSNKESPKKCKMKGICPMSQGWNRVNDAIYKALTEVSLADMALFPFDSSFKKRA